MASSGIGATKPGWGSAELAPPVQVSWAALRRAGLLGRERGGVMAPRGCGPASLTCVWGVARVGGHAETLAARDAADDAESEAQQIDP